MDTTMSKKLINKRTAKSERGAAMIDYAILVSMVAVVCLGSLVAFSNNIRKVYCERIMQIAFLDNKRAGKLLITWVPADGVDSAYCINEDGSGDRDTDILF